MIDWRIDMKATTVAALERRLARARQQGDRHALQKIQGLLALNGGRFAVREVAVVLHISEQCVYNWIKDFLLRRLDSVQPQKSPGRPEKLTKTQKRELSKLIDAGPEKSGYPGACWRSPMIQDPH